MLLRQDRATGSTAGTDPDEAEADDRRTEGIAWASGVDRMREGRPAAGRRG